VIRANQERYLLSHDREHHMLHLTVYGGDGNESAPSTVLRKLRTCLGVIADDFGVHFRFEVQCELRGELGWYPLDDIGSSSSDTLSALYQLWLAHAADTEPEPEPEHPPESDAPTNPGMAARFPVHAMEDRRCDYFINHCQTSGQDQCANLEKLLTAAGKSVWYDMQAQDLTAQGMEEGVSQSRNMLIFLSDDVMGRPFCNAEQRWAKLYNCNLIGVVEKDSRHSPADFGTEKERAPPDLKYILDEVEFIPYERRNYQVKAMVSEITRRGAEFQSRTRSPSEGLPPPSTRQLQLDNATQSSLLAVDELSSHREREQPELAPQLRLELTSSQLTQQVVSLRQQVRVLALAVFMLIFALVFARWLG
jgi:hypothetical protein